MGTTTDSTIQYSQETLDRAARAVICSPFTLALLTKIQTQSVALGTIAGATGVQQGYTSLPLSELVAEDHLMWLIQVGVLRREVDGQGLTDSFWLTPLGRQLLNRWQAEGKVVLPQASVSDRIKNALARWFRLPT